MNVSILGDRRIPLPTGWSKETLVGILGDTQVDATASPEPGAWLKIVGLFSDTTGRDFEGRDAAGHVVSRRTACPSWRACPYWAREIVGSAWARPPGAGGEVAGFAEATGRPKDVRIRPA